MKSFCSDAPAGLGRRDDDPGPVRATVRRVRSARLSGEVCPRGQLRPRLQFLPGGLHQRPPRSGRAGVVHRLPRRRAEFLDPAVELTKTRVSKDSHGTPEHLVVRLTEDALYQCPYLHMEDVGTAALHRSGSARRCAAYLLKGGFLWVDDYWGTYAWQNWASQLARVLPPSRISGSRHPARSSRVQDDVRGEGAAADSVDSVLADERRRHLRARLGQRGPRTCAACQTSTAT